MNWLPPGGRALTQSDLAALPDDGHRYELIDGVLIVSPAPSMPHQSMLLELAFRLKVGCPPELKVFVAPLDVTYADDTVLQPDLLVVNRPVTGQLKLETGPVLAVELLSPSTRHLDLALSGPDTRRRAARPTGSSTRLLRRSSAGNCRMGPMQRSREPRARIRWR